MKARATAAEVVWAMHAERTNVGGLSRKRDLTSPKACAIVGGRQGSGQAAGQPLRGLAPVFESQRDCIMSDTFVEPARFALFVFFPHNGKQHRRRIGNYSTLGEARKAALDNERDAVNPPTFGGLIGWPKDKGGRTYRIFEATGWVEHPATAAPARKRRAS